MSAVGIEKANINEERPGMAIFFKKTTATHCDYIVPLVWICLKRLLKKPFYIILKSFFTKSALRYYRRRRLQFRRHRQKLKLVLGDETWRSASPSSPWGRLRIPPRRGSRGQRPCCMTLSCSSWNLFQFSSRLVESFGLCSRWCENCKLIEIFLFKIGISIYKWS